MKWKCSSKYVVLQYLINRSRIESKVFHAFASIIFHSLNMLPRFRNADCRLQTADCRVDNIGFHCSFQPMHFLSKYLRRFFSSRSDSFSVATFSSRCLVLASIFRETSFHDILYTIGISYNSPHRCQTIQISECKFV